MRRIESYSVFESNSELSRLSDEIFAFLAKYGGIKADYDPKWDKDNEKWNSPDASDMFVAAELLRHGRIPRDVPFSDWGNGGYRPQNSVEGRKEHDRLVDLVRRLVRR